MVSNALTQSRLWQAHNAISTNDPRPKGCGKSLSIALFFEICQNFDQLNKDSVKSLCQIQLSKVLKVSLSYFCIRIAITHALISNLQQGCLFRPCNGSFRHCCNTTAYFHEHTSHRQIFRDHHV